MSDRSDKTPKTGGAFGPAKGKQKSNGRPSQRRARAKIQDDEKYDVSSISALITAVLACVLKSECNVQQRMRKLEGCV